MHPERTVFGSGPDARIIERFKRLDAGRLHYEFTIDDPASFASPWTAAVPLVKNDQPVYEYACHEGNYSMPLLLNGGRALEREEAASR